jgi:hypothetical protein
MDLPDCKSRKREMRQVLLAQIEFRFVNRTIKKGMGETILTALIELKLVTHRDLINWGKMVL